MRKVLRNSTEVAHVWASRSQEEGRTSTSNCSFKGDSIYSYGWWEMARFVDTKDGTVVIMRNWSYSCTTGKHINDVRAALRGLNLPVIYVYGSTERSWYSGRASGDLIHHESNTQRIILDMKNLNFDFKKSRNPEYEIGRIEGLYETLQKYCKAFEIPVPEEAKGLLIDRDDSVHYIARRKKENELREANKEINAEKRRLQAIKDNEKKLLDWNTHEQRWMDGENVSTDFSIQTGRSYWDKISYEFSQTRLRIKDDMVQTSRQAYVPVRDAKILWNAIKLGHDIKGHRIGSYTVISLNGVLKIGCHEITREEMTRFVEKYNW